MNRPLSSQHHIHLDATVTTHSGIFIVKLGLSSQLNSQEEPKILHLVLLIILLMF